MHGTVYKNQRENIFVEGGTIPLDKKDEVVLYSTHCPMCMLLEKKLKDKHIEYQEVNDVEEMRSLGFTSVPMLKVNGEIMATKEAIQYLDKV